MKKYIVPKILLIISIILFTGCSTSTFSALIPSSTGEASTPAPLKKTTLWNNHPQQLWENLQVISLSRLKNMASNHPDAIQHAWIQLAILSKQKEARTNDLIKELINWRTRYPTHPANVLFPNDTTLNQLLSSPAPQHLAVLLPQQGEFGSSGQKIREGLLSTYYASLSQNNKQTIQFYDTSQSKNVSALYQQAVSQGADFIIGPLIKQQVEQLRQSTAFVIPTLALNYTTNGHRSLPSHFYEFGLLPEDEASQMAGRAQEAGLSQAIIIAPRTAWGNRLVSAFSTKWQAIGGHIQETWYYSSPNHFNEQIARLLKVSMNSNKKLIPDNDSDNKLAQQRRHDFDVIFLFAQPQEARIIVPLLKYYYANNIPIYATSAVYTGRINSIKNADLNGVIVCDIPWKKQIMNNQEDRLYAVGQDAYLLSQALPRLILLPSFPIYGSTGALTLSTQHQIHRRLPCIAIHNGRIG
jgi:outer membrane PBP1 activator LpoA protein